jgi:quercetin dioxygenase-like cupin family protein
MIRKHGHFSWEGIQIHPYKEDGTLFKSVTRQTLFSGGHDLPVELRYFEVGVGGHSTLERHQHSHLVTIIRGSGRVLVGDEVTEVCCNDVVHIPPMTWHQFRPDPGEELGFLCIVSVERDRPQRPSEADLEHLNAQPEVAEFIRV